MDKEIEASIEAFRNRKIYTRLDQAILRSIPDAEVEQAVFDYAASKLDGRYEREAEVLASLPPGVRALYLTWIVDGEVNNGGFNQYYFNTEGAFAEDAATAFQFFGAEQHAALMREANSVRAEEAKLMKQFKDAGTLEAFSESYAHTKLGPLDDRYFKLGDELSLLRISRIRQTPEQFTGQ